MEKRAPITLPQFKLIDDKLKSIGNLANYDPLFKIVRERFLSEMNHHLTSLSGAQSSSLDRLRSQPEAKPQNLIAAYLDLGREHAVHHFLTDLAEQPLNVDRIFMLAEILFGKPMTRDSELEIRHPSGNTRSTPTPSSIFERMDALIRDYRKARKENREHPIVLATQLHHGITGIHPFKDWNGRIARLILNVALMKSNCLPVLIERAERQNYYEYLEAADMGDLEPIVRFIADKQLDSIDSFTSSPQYLSIKTKFELDKRLNGLGPHERCLVLTEDGVSNSLLKVLLESSGFLMKETKLISYEGCSKIASANLFSMFVKEKMPHVQVLVHRDRDYLTDAEIAQQHETFHRIDVRFFCTQGTDIESHFLNADHIHHCYPTISIKSAQAMVNDVINELLPKSVDYLYKKEFGSRRECTTHLHGALVRLVHRNRERFTHGKTALRVLESRLQKTVRSKPKLDRPSPALAAPKLVDVAKQIWGKRN